MQTESTTPATGPSRGRLLRRLGLIALGLCVIVGVTLFAITASNRAKLHCELQTIEERGEPVVLPPAAETEAGRATREWLRQFEDAELEWPPELLDVCPELADSSNPEGRSCRLLQDGVPREQWDECERAFLATCELAYPQLQTALRGPIPSHPLDAEPGPGLERIPQKIPWLGSAVRAVLLPTHAMIARGDAAEVTTRIQKALQLNALYGLQVSQIALMARVVFAQRALAVARMALAQLPADAALDPLEALLAGREDQRTQFRRAMLQERAMLNELFAQIIEGDLPMGDPHAGPWSALMSFDQPYCLSTFAEVLEISKRDSPVLIGAGLLELTDRIQTHFGSWKRYTTPVSSFLIPRFIDAWNALQDERAWIDLVRLGLRLRRLAPQEALTEAAHSIDPYNGRPFLARIEPDGLLALWSVGRNGRDDGGPTQVRMEEEPELDDLVLRVRMR